VMKSTTDILKDGWTATQKNRHAVQSSTATATTLRYSTRHGFPGDRFGYRMGALRIRGLCISGSTFSRFQFVRFVFICFFFLWGLVWSGCIFVFFFFFFFIVWRFFFFEFFFRWNRRCDFPPRTTQDSGYPSYIVWSCISALKVGDRRGGSWGLSNRGR
jgi:hypothetical protein